MLTTYNHVLMTYGKLRMSMGNSVTVMIKMTRQHPSDVYVHGMSQHEDRSCRDTAAPRNASLRILQDTSTCSYGNRRVDTCHHFGTVCAPNRKVLLHKKTKRRRKKK